MDLPVAGAHCSYCNDFDFLPLRCHCHKYFCTIHITPDVHDCPVDLASLNPSPIGVQQLARCTMERCGKPALVSYRSTGSGFDDERSPVTCFSCRKLFCIDHRHEKSHACSVQECHIPPTQPSPTLLANLQIRSSSSEKNAAVVRRPTKAPTDPKKLALYNRIELMRIRHHAIPGNPKASSIPIQERLHVKVISNGIIKEEKALWFSKSTVTGKVLDLIVDKFRITSDANTLQLVKISPVKPEECSVLHNNEVFANQVEDGSTLSLVRSNVEYI